MIYLVTREQSLFELEGITPITVEQSLELLNSWDFLQYDSETNGRDPHLCKLLCIQFGDLEGKNQVVVDTLTIDVNNYKDILETKYLIGHNLKFDLQFLYNHDITPRKIYDTMIVEQLLYLGFPPKGTYGGIGYSLHDVAERRLNIDIDKSVRGQIIWRGLDLSVIKYAAGDVQYLGQIMHSQIKDCKERNCSVGAKLECDAVPSIAYMEWCGIMLNVDKWKNKMKQDLINLENSKKDLDNFIINHPILSKEYSYVDTQGNLFTGFDLTPKCTINWSSSRQVVNIAKALGFDTKVEDKKTGEEKESVLEKQLKMQKGINDEFLKLYFDYQGYAKVVSSFGQGHLNCINPKTDRIHSTFKQLGASSGRLSCGSQQPNTDLAALKNIPGKECTYPNLQQLPSDEPTRSAFVAPKGYNFVSADFSAEESRLGADIYQDKAFLKEFTEGSGDTHSMFAWAVFKNECIKCGCKGVSDVKKLAPQWRKAVKAVEFAYMFGAAAPTISKAANCSVEQAQAYIDALDKEFTGMSAFARKGSKFVRENGYVVINKNTGHKLYWWDHKEWLERQKSFNSEFWDDYRTFHKGTGDEIAQMVRQHFQAAGKWDRMVRNSPTQGTGAIILKDSLTSLFNWIVDNKYFNKVHICCAVHDEIVADYPKEIEDFPKILEKIMETSASKFCKSLPIPAEASVGDHWIH